MAKRKKNGGVEQALDQSFKLKKISPMTDTQSDVFDAYYENFNLFLYGCAGTGKAQPLDANILTPNGWVQMGELMFGDIITAHDGTESTITGIFPQGITDVYRVTFDDGRTVDCAPDHLWKVYMDTPQYKDGRVIDTLELLRLKTFKSYENRLRIDLYSPSEGNLKSLPLPPYVMGLLLGDGCFGRSFVGFSTSDDYLYESLRKSLSVGYWLSPCGKYEYRIVQGSGQSNFYVNAIKTLQLDEVKSEDKWIPVEYLTGSLSQRIELLQGLLDTDGTADKSGSVSFSTSSERLAQDVQYLVWSIGGIAGITPKQTFYSYNVESKPGKPSFTIRIRYKNTPSLFRLERKNERVTFNQYSENLRLGVAKVEFSGQKETQCIMIDHPDNLYVTNGFVVTHNTYISLFLALKEVLNPNSPYRKVYMIRSSVPSRGMGFLPGKPQEKMSVYEAPYMSMIKDLFGRGDAYTIAVQKGVFEMVSTSFLRGMTFDNCIVIADEIQNCSFQELDTLITRVGNNTKVILCGDIEQCDLIQNKYDVTGLPQFKQILDRMESFDFVEFQAEDIVRSGLVKDYIMQKRNLNHRIAA